MFGHLPRDPVQKIGFLLTPDFSMVAFTSALEPLRLVNRLERSERIQWTLYTLDGGSVQASNGVTLNPDHALTDTLDCDVLFICSGVQVYRHLSPALNRILRILARKATPLGSLCTGTAILADAGVLDGYRCTIHWESLESLAERYPALTITANLFEIDRNRYTCSGGLAAMDMMLNSIEQDYGVELSMRVADQMLYTAKRTPQNLQKMDLEQRSGLSHPKLLAAIGHMEAHIEAPLSLHHLSRAIGLSVRQLERLFQAELKTTPVRYYRNLRLERARVLIRQTSMKLPEIAFATGFGSASYFAKNYREKFGYTPREERNGA